jgi:hypothetical protein
MKEIITLFAENDIYSLFLVGGVVALLIASLMMYMVWEVRRGRGVPEGKDRPLRLLCLVAGLCGALLFTINYWAFPLGVLIPILIFKGAALYRELLNVMKRSFMVMVIAVIVIWFCGLNVKAIWMDVCGFILYFIVGILLFIQEYHEDDEEVIFIIEHDDAYYDEEDDD